MEDTPPNTATKTRQARHDVGTRLQALCLLEQGFPAKRIEEITGVSISQIYNLRRTAKARGYNPETSKKLLISYVEDGARSGRPPKGTEDVNDHVAQADAENSTTPYEGPYSQLVAHPGVNICTVNERGELQLSSGFTSSSNVVESHESAAEELCVRNPRSVYPHGPP